MDIMYVFDKTKYINDLVSCGYPLVLTELLKEHKHLDKLQEWLQAEFNIKPVLELDGQVAKLSKNGVTLKCNRHAVSKDWCREVDTSIFIVGR